MNNVIAIAQTVQAQAGRALIVGGWVRDRLMECPSKDIDIEVFGVQSDDLRTLLETFGPVNCVGSAFGVYKLSARPVDAQTDDLDVSIPRRDSKTGEGHAGFTVEGDPFMSVEDAARRRDFTINAISYDLLTEEYLDPFNGRQDIKNGILRLVDPHRFTDDSLRVLRGIQFAARFGFTMDETTRDVCRGIDLSDLPAERVWGEFAKLLLAPRPSIGLRLADSLGVLDKLWPELAALKGVPQDPVWHPEGDVWTHTLQVIDAAATLLSNTEAGTSGERMAVLLGSLCHDLGKPTTTEMIEGRWRALGHESAGVLPASQLLDRLNVQTMDGYDVRQQVLALVEHHMIPLAWYKNQPSASAFRRLAHKVNLVLLALVSAADVIGRHPRPVDLSPIEWFTLTVKDLDLRVGPPPAILMGRHLIELGVKPGVQMGKILTAVYEQQMDGSITTLDEAIAAAAKQIER